MHTVSFTMNVMTLTLIIAKDIFNTFDIANKINK